MDKKLIAHSFYLSLIFQSNIYALGSYLYCTNTNASPQEITIKGTGWDWAKGSDKDNILQEYKDVVTVYNNGIWLWGRVYISPISLGVNKNFESYYHAKEFCNALRKKCQSDFGDSFKNVGVASWSIAQATWGKISFHYLQKSGYAFGYCSDIN